MGYQKQPISNSLCYSFSTNDRHFTTTFVAYQSDQNTDEETQTYQVWETLFGKDEEAKKWVQMVNKFNPHIYEAFYADKVLLVEGDTETIVYRDLLTRFFPDEEIFVLNTGSKMNIPFFRKLSQLFIQNIILYTILMIKKKSCVDN